MTLYEIKAGIEGLIDVETGEITNEEEFNALFDNLQEKRQNIALLYKNKRAEWAALKAEKDAFDARMRQAARTMEWCEKTLAAEFGGKKYTSELYEVSFIKSKETVINDISKIPAKYLTQQEPKPQKAEIKKAILAGEKIDGAEVREKLNIKIK